MLQPNGSRSGFAALCIMLKKRGVYFSNRQVCRHSISKMISTVIFYFVSRGSYRAVAVAMGVSKAFAVTAEAAVFTALLSILPRIVTLLDHLAKGVNLKKAFEDQPVFPCVVGAVDEYLFVIEWPDVFNTSRSHVVLCYMFYNTT